MTSSTTALFSTIIASLSEKVSADQSGKTVKDVICTLCDTSSYPLLSYAVLSCPVPAYKLSRSRIFLICLSVYLYGINLIICTLFAYSSFRKIYSTTHFTSKQCLSFFPILFHIAHGCDRGACKVLVQLYTIWALYFLAWAGCRVESEVWEGDMMRKYHPGRSYNITIGRNTFDILWCVGLWPASLFLHSWHQSIPITCSYACLPCWRTNSATSRAAQSHLMRLCIVCIQEMTVIASISVRCHVPWCFHVQCDAMRCELDWDQKVIGNKICVYLFKIKLNCIASVENRDKCNLLVVEVRRGEARRESKVCVYLLDREVSFSCASL